MAVTEQGARIVNVSMMWERRVQTPIQKQNVWIPSKIDWLLVEHNLWTTPTYKADNSMDMNQKKFQHCSQTPRAIYFVQ